MTHDQLPTTRPPGTADPDWRTLHRTGALCAALYVGLVLVPVVLVFVAPLPPTRGVPLLEYIAAHKLIYLTELVCFVGLAVPALVVFTALTVALWPVEKNLAVIGGLFGIASEIIALSLGSSPQSLHGGLVILSDSFATTDSEAQRSALAGAAEALIATTNAVSWAGILTAAAILVLSLAMRRATVTGLPGWGRFVATFGIVTGAAGLLCEALRPMIGGAYLLYGLLLPTWFALVGWHLHRLSRRQQTPAQSASQELDAGSPH